MPPDDIKRGDDLKYSRPDFLLSRGGLCTKIERFLHSGGATSEAWNGRLMRECCTLISTSAETAGVVYEALIRLFQCNVGAVLHGGAAGTILDYLASTALFTISNPGFLNRRMVGRTLIMAYQRPMPMGTKSIVEAEVVSAAGVWHMSEES